jgi:hypothetical protein
LRLANPEAGSYASPFAIVRPESLPDGSLFPPARSNREQWDLQAQYLGRLREKYPGKIYVVLYYVAREGLLEESVVQYWIQEQGYWRIAALQGTDW